MSLTILPDYVNKDNGTHNSWIFCDKIIYILCPAINTQISPTASHIIKYLLNIVMCISVRACARAHACVHKMYTNYSINYATNFYNSWQLFPKFQNQKIWMFSNSSQLQIQSKFRSVFNVFVDNYNNIMMKTELLIYKIISSKKRARYVNNACVYIIYYKSVYKNTRSNIHIKFNILY